MDSSQLINQLFHSKNLIKMDNVFSDTRVRDIQKMLEAKLGGILPPGKVQLGVLRAFRPLTSNDKTVTFNLGDKSRVIPELEMLMPDDRITVVFSQSVGIYAVPTVAGVQDVANGKFVASPHTAVFTPAVVKSLEPFFNSRLTFVTDQTTRFDALSTSMFRDTNHQASTEVPYGMKHLFLPIYFPVVGGKTNTIVATMPSASVITDIAGTATLTNYACMEFGVMYLVGGDSDKILNALFGPMG